MDGDDQTASDPSAMGDIVDDEFEVTLESPREQMSLDEQESSILKLIQSENHTENVDDKINIPSIVVTDTNNSGGDQIDPEKQIEGETSVVDGTDEIVNDESNSQEDKTKDSEIEFTSLTHDDHQNATTEIEDVKHGKVDDADNDDNIGSSAQLQFDALNDINTDIMKSTENEDHPKREVQVEPENLEESGNLKNNHNETELHGKEDSLVENKPTGLVDISSETNATTSSVLSEDNSVQEESISLDSILVKEKTGEDSDPDEFDFDLPTKKTPTGTEKQVTFKDTEAVSAEQQSAINSNESEDSTKKATLTTNQEQATIIPGNKPVAVIKPTTQANIAGTQSKYSVEAASASGSGDEQRNQRVLESAQAEWDRVTTITAGFSEKGTAEGPEPTVVETTPAMSPHEMTEYLKTADFSQVQSSVRTTVERRGFSAFVHLLFGPPKLNKSLLQERDMIFYTAASPLSNENSYHIRTLQTIYRCLTGSKFDCPRTGSHWEEIGFQGSDPATDLRGAGLLGLVNLLQFLKDPKRHTLASDIYRLSLHPTQNFPFCVMGINMSRIALQTLREEFLNKECNRRGDVLGVVNDFYVGLYLQMYQVWKSQGKTIQDSGYVIKDIETNAKKNPRGVLKNLDDYLNKKKTVIVAEKSPESGGDNFLSICDDNKT